MNHMQLSWGSRYALCHKYMGRNDRTTNQYGEIDCKACRRLMSRTRRLKEIRKEARRTKNRLVYDGMRDHARTFHLEGTTFRAKFYTPRYHSAQLAEKRKVA